jgi:cardiolipin synthase
MSSAGQPWWERPEPKGAWFQAGSDRVRLLRDGAQALPVMLRAIAAAKREIVLEMYWIGADDVGRRFRDALAQRAREGVTVRVIYDALGSLTITPSFWAPLSIRGGEIREYHPIVPFRPAFKVSRLEQRDHRKLLVIDGTHGFTGGLNLAAPWLPKEDGGEAWRDDMIEVDGHASAELRTLFYKTWRQLGLRNMAEGPVRALRIPHDLVSLSRRPKGKAYVLASLRRSNRSLRRETLARLHAATRSIDLANSYFLPDHRVRNALFRAKERGVRVRVLVPAKSDVTIVQYSLEAMYESLLHHGIEIYCHQGTMMHAKTAILDDSFVMIGSYNLDERSTKKNLEVSIAVEDEAFARHVREGFELDLQNATALNLFVWRARPLMRRGIERVAYALRKFW